MYLFSSFLTKKPPNGGCNQILPALPLIVMNLNLPLPRRERRTRFAERSGREGTRHGCAFSLRY